MLILLFLLSLCQKPESSLAQDGFLVSNDYRLERLLEDLKSRGVFPEREQHSREVHMELGTWLVPQTPQKRLRPVNLVRWSQNHNPMMVAICQVATPRQTRGSPL